MWALDFRPDVPGTTACDAPVSEDATAACDAVSEEDVVPVAADAGATAVRDAVADDAGSSNACDAAPEEDVVPVAADADASKGVAKES